MLAFVLIALLSLTQTAILLVAGVIQCALGTAGVGIVNIITTGEVCSRCWRSDFFFTAASSNKGERTNQGEKQKGVQGLFFHDVHFKKKERVLFPVKLTPAGKKMLQFIAIFYYTFHRVGVNGNFENDPHF